MINITHNVNVIAYCLRKKFSYIKIQIYTISRRIYEKKLQFDHNRSLLIFF